MRLGEYLNKQLIIPELTSASKAEVLREIVECISSTMPELDTEQAVQVLMDRESLGSTGIGDGIAIPHGKLEALDRIVVAVARSPQGVEFESLDHAPCHIVFLVMAPEQVAGLHLRILAHISRLLKDQTFRANLMAADGKDGLWQLLQAT
ncbi:PTS IIA-like nitrogen-regulatory protein PtsN [Paucidesulfovibrio gracilis DSM 16080]|uniref:PTS IIA-like nitrogen-regulatory protein PtsN n=1 Tax=Paucidesulfovibrio gracilis DSM 16080 TaxID=1121449 RepID=A0A1T4WLY7_9BACT|nr:PTS sugar transporter subunit IIA [Paucidesulfovibrio gracilis]SKA78366.1 PTS IIA-like nitrogen-regulatory protein PtsN [Paucidesulfovibrio gracilis DSM 16080]